MKYNKLAAIALVLSIILISGCLGLSVYAKINADGSVSNYKVMIDTTSFVYQMIKTQAQDGGYAGVEQYITSNISQNLGNGMDPGKMEYKEEWSGDQVTMTLTYKGSFKPDADTGMKIRREGNHIIFEYVMATASPTPTPVPMDDNPFSGLADTLLTSVTFNVYIEMPGKIIDSTADKVDGNKAEWHLNGKTMNTKPIYAKSEVPATPGFEAMAGAVGLLIAAGLLVGFRKKY